MSKPVRAELRIDNTVYECSFEKKLYNSVKVKPFVVVKIMGVTPDMKNPGDFSMTLGSIMICENCYKENKGEKGLGFEDPSDLILPTNDAISKLNLKKN